MNAEDIKSWEDTLAYCQQQVREKTTNLHDAQKKLDAADDELTHWILAANRATQFLAKARKE